MARLPIIFISILACGNLFADEFDVARFQNSSFACNNSVDCGNGTCSNTSCVCTLGYRDSVEAPCEHQMVPRPNPNLAWALEAAFGLIFPVGWFVVDLWPMALARIGVEIIAGSLLVGYSAFRHYPLREIRQEKRGPILLLGFGTLAALGHIVFYAVQTSFLAKFGTKQLRESTGWHKDRGEADITVLADRAADSARITLDHFTDDSCAVVEGCLSGRGERRLLRWDELIYNMGDADFVKGAETQAKPVWSPCHQHYHGRDTAHHFVRRQLLNASNHTVFEVITGYKGGYCYVDSERISGSYEGKFDCGSPQFLGDKLQGITSGWADEYSSDTECQWIDITGVAPGRYQLTTTVNPLGIYYQDKDLTNNRAVIDIVIPPVDYRAERSRRGIRVNATVVSGVVTPGLP